MDDITVFNLRVVNKGALKATMSIRLGNGLTVHDCKIIQQDGMLNAALPQRSERLKGGEVVYHDLVEFADPKTWPAIAPQLVAYYQAANEESQASVTSESAQPKRQRKTTSKKKSPSRVSPCWQGIAANSSLDFSSVTVTSYMRPYLSGLSLYTAAELLCGGWHRCWYKAE